MNDEETLDIRCAFLDELMHLWCYAKMPISLSKGDDNDDLLPPNIQSINLKSKEEVYLERKTFGDVFCGEKAGDTGETEPSDSIFHGMSGIEIVAVANTENHSLIQVVKTRKAALRATTLLYGLLKKKVVKKADIEKLDGEWRSRHAKALESNLSF